MFINHKHKFIFIHVPKNAGTSIRNSFELNGYDQRVVKRQYPHDPCSKIRKYCGEEVWNTFFKFAIVRNPYDRLVSYYHFHKSPQYKYPSRARKLNFLEWLGCGLDQNVKKSQSWYLDQDVDYLGRYENLNEDWNCICTEMGIPSYSLPKYNVSNHNIWNSYYDESSRDMVYEYYETDFNRFKYSK